MNNASSNIFIIISENEFNFSINDYFEKMSDGAQEEPEQKLAMLDTSHY